jgi:hypothetical protein
MDLSQEGFKPRGVYVTVVPPPLTNTAVLAKLGFDPRTMPIKPMSVEQCVSEGLNALRENRSRIIVHGRFSGHGPPVPWIAGDIVRIENGGLAEHWDVLQDEVTKAESKSGLPMFGDAFTV